MTDTEQPRTSRWCDSCGKWDDSPRHVALGAPGYSTYPDGWFSDHIGNVPAGSEEEARRQWADTATTMKHPDCCAADGCPDGSCNAIVEESGGLQDAELVAYITSDESRF